eukprot:5750452-Karenia_brevis.AAC.1
MESPRAKARATAKLSRSAGIVARWATQKLNVGPLAEARRMQGADQEPVAVEGPEVVDEEEDEESMAWKKRVSQHQKQAKVKLSKSQNKSA